jgi:hypothetical protein
MKQLLHTRAAFAQLVNTRGAEEMMGISANLLKYYKHRIRHDLPLQEATMQRMLHAAGYTIQQQLLWHPPTATATT